MTVLKGEGKVSILYGTYSSSVGTVNPSFYVARPDLIGAFPTVVVVPPAWGVTPSIKYLCRTLARWGLSVVTADVYSRNSPDRDMPVDDAARLLAEHHDDALSSVRRAAQLVTNPSVFWSNAEEGFGLLGLGDGGRLAVEAAAGPGVEALAIAYTPLRQDGGGFDEIPRIAALPMPVLGLFGKADARVPIADVMALREASAHAELVVYPEIGHDFLDDFRDGFDFNTMIDAVERLVAFFEKSLPAGTAIDE